MSMIKQMNEQMLAEQADVQAWKKVLTENCVALNMSADTVTVLAESAEEFLGQLALLVQNNKLAKDADDTKLRDSITMLTVLDLLRNPQSREATGINTVKGYLNIINGISRGLDKNGIEVKVMSDLDQMKDEHGKNGMDVRAQYIKLALSNDNAELLKKIKLLSSQYSQITGKLNTLAKQPEQAAAKQPAQVKPQPQQAAPAQQPAGQPASA